VNILTQAVHARLDITIHRLSLGMRVEELPMIGIGMIAIVAVPIRHAMVICIGHIIVLSGEYKAMQRPNLKISLQNGVLRL